MFSWLLYCERTNCYFYWTYRVLFSFLCIVITSVLMWCLIACIMFYRWVSCNNNRSVWGMAICVFDIATLNAINDQIRITQFDFVSISLVSLLFWMHVCEYRKETEVAALTLQHSCNLAFQGLVQSLMTSIRVLVYTSYLFVGSVTPCIVNNLFILLYCILTSS